MVSLDIGKRIAYLRREKHIKQSELANLLSVSTQAISKWESGACYPDIELLPSIAGYFQVSVDYLLGIQDVVIEGSGGMTVEGVADESGISADELTEDAPATKRIDYAKKCNNRSIGLYYRAEEQLLKVIAESDDEQNIDCIQAHEQIIRMRCKENLSKQTVEQYKRRCTENPKEWQNYYLLALAYFQCKKYKDAKETLQNIISINHGFAAVYQLAGDVNKALNADEEAILFYKKAYEADKTGCAALYSQAYLYEKMNRYEDAIKMWQNIIEWLQRNNKCENHELDWPLVKMTELIEKNN